MRGTNIFKVIGDDLRDIAAGRIRWQRNMWAIVGSRWDRKRCLPKWTDAPEGIIRDGKVLVKRLCAHCPNPPGDDYAQSARANETVYWSVPQTECRKCQFYRPASRQFRFPRCVFGKGESAPEVYAQVRQDFIRLVTTVTDDAKKMQA